MNTIRMVEEINLQRRRFFGTAALTVAAAQLGMLGSADAQTSEANPDAATSMQRTNPSFSPLKQIDADLLSVAYAEAGPANGPAVILLHGWPYDIHSFVDVTPILASAGYRVIVPYLRGYGTTSFLSSATMRNGQQSAVALDIIALMDALKIQKAVVAGFDWGARTAANQAPLPPKPTLAFWYQYYFATEIGKAGYEKYLHDFAKLIWQTASPKWDFDDATFERSAASLNNPDHVAIAIHNYRWRIGLADGERKYDDLENRLAALPSVAVPAITMEGDSNGAIHAPSEAYRNKFSGKYEYRLISDGVGHNLPQEAPEAFAKAVIDVDRF
jgi:pimeloyl-ACP methyl ester carboxylesterase